MESIWDQLLVDGKVEKNEDQKEVIKTHEFDINLSLSEIKKRDIAFQIYSEYVDDTFWICSNEKMVEQMKIDDPENVVYHINEIVKINRLKPDIKSLKSIHEAKKCFKNSQVIKTKTDTGGLLIEKKPNSE